MERYNPFAAEQEPGGPAVGRPRPAELPVDESDPFAIQPILRRQTSGGSQQQQQAQAQRRQEDAEAKPPATSSRYTTSFPDPFGDEHAPTPGPRVAPPTPSKQQQQQSQRARQQTSASNRSNSVTFLHKIGSGPGERDDDDGTASEFGQTGPAQPIQRGGRQASGGFTSFLSRATSVTSSSVTDRVTGAVGSVRSAVDSLSSQIQSAVPAGLNERLTGGSADQISSLGGGGPTGLATGQGGGDRSLPAICRQRVVLILDAPGTDWAAAFTQYRRLLAGLPAQSSAAAPLAQLSSFFSSQFSSGGSSGSLAGGPSALGASSVFASGFAGAQAELVGADLIEQADLLDVSVLANQSNASAGVLVGGASASPATPSSASSSSVVASLPQINRLTSSLSLVGGGGGGGSGGGPGQQATQMQAGGGGLATPASGQRIVRPEFVIVRQRAAKQEHLEHLKATVRALDYCLVPTFEPYEVWNVFQDRQRIFAKLLRVQRRLGKERFPLIPQVFCQTHKDLMNYINSNSGQSIPLPCLVRTGPLGRGKIRIENLQMLRDFATIMATSGQSCTIEQFLEVKCDLLVQRLGTSLKLFKRNLARKASLSGQQQQQQQANDFTGGDSFCATDSPASTRPSASRQISLGGGGGGGVFSNLISSTGGGSQSFSSSSIQIGRKSSNPSQVPGGPSTFEKLAEVNARYRQWVEAIAGEFDNKIEAFSIKLVVASNDREYIVGLRNCSMEFLGNQENQDEDRRSFVELIISKMNTILPKHQQQQQPASSSEIAKELQQVRRTSSDDEARPQQLASRMANDKRGAFMSQTDVTGGGGDGGPRPGKFMSQDVASSPAYGQAVGHQQQLANRSHSVSANQAEAGTPTSGAARWAPSQSMVGHHQQQQQPAQQAAGARRSSERAESLFASDEFSLSQSPAASQGTGQAAGGVATGANYQRQYSLGQSFFDQTSTALSSFQRQSMSFLKRLDTRTGSDLLGGAGTPPLSAKSDTAFDRNFDRATGGGVAAPAPPARSPLANGSNSLEVGAATGSPLGLTRTSSVKSTQSVDATSAAAGSESSLSRFGGAPPPKPPPPPAAMLVNRQSSLASGSYSVGRSGGQTQQQRRADSTVSAKSNPMITPQNSLAQSNSFSDPTIEPSAGAARQAGPQAAAATTTTSQRQGSTQRVVRQNSALSAFEPFDSSLRSESSNREPQQQANDANRLRQSSSASQSASIEHQDSSAGRRISASDKSSATGKFDNVSMKSGNSNTSEETTTAEDTMNNLKKTFASIFGDKCE